MDSLKRAMRWDEEAFGREYDLDLFMIVAVRDFNFGAMENKGLNIFNSSLLLADAETATDADYERIESVIAHEYFHNWTGDRITCRDWFQLCLKEGLTVFRDQEFSADQRSRAVQRIKDVKQLRARQFAEDAGPLAHPVRPSSYLKIDNFYTATIYEKGLRGHPDAQDPDRPRRLPPRDGPVVRALRRHRLHRRSLRRLLRRGLRPRPLQLLRLVRTGRHAPGLDHHRLRRSRPGARPDAHPDHPAHPGQPTKRPLPVPVALGLLDADGAPQTFRTPGGNALVQDAVIVLDQAEQTIRLENVERAPALSALRGFSAPVTLTTDAPPKDAYLQLAADPDLFNRWEAGQSLARALILRRADGSPDEVNEERYADALGRALADSAAEPAFKALLLGLPSEADLALAMQPADPHALHDAREALRARIAVHLRGELASMHTALQDGGEFSASAEAAGRRALRNAALDMLAAEPRSDTAQRADGHYRAANTMTDRMGGLNALMLIGGPEFEAALADFYARFEREPLVVDKWFALQARNPAPDALARVQALTAHPAFDPKTPTASAPWSAASPRPTPCASTPPTAPATAS
jgi:aminopeptidase N